MTINTSNPHHGFLEESYHLESSAPEVILQNDYQLALKIFMNRDIAKSYAMTKKLAQASYATFKKGLIDEDLYIKITTLYMTEVGLLLNPRESFGAISISQAEAKHLKESLRNEDVLNQVVDIYGSLRDTPSELLYQIFLVYYTCRDAIQSEDQQFVLNKFKTAHHVLQYSGKEDDRYLKRWFDMFVLNVLPDAGDFDTSFAIAETNHTFGGQATVAKLKDIQETRKQEQKVREKKKRDWEAHEAKRKANEQEKQRKEAEERDLKYRSLKQIRQEHEESDSLREKKSKPGSGGRVPTLTLDILRDRLLHYLAYSQKMIRDNSPVILATIVLLFISGRVLRNRRINLKDKFKETLQMAFKISYL